MSKPHSFITALFAFSLIAACASLEPRAWSGFDALNGKAPAAEQRLGEVAISEADYQRFLRLGELWFREMTFGNERTMTDLVGVLNGTLTVPCEGPGSAGCVRSASAMYYFAQAIDALDGQKGNLYTGNGGSEGNGFTSDLVVEFPAGARLFGIPLPARLHTGLDVEAGAAWPLGVVPVPATGNDSELAHLIDPTTLGAGPMPGVSKMRVGLSCALCHYSLDIDGDGTADLKTATYDSLGAYPTGTQRAGAYLGEQAGKRGFNAMHSWSAGNQDLHLGWLFALTQNPLLGFAVLSGPVGKNKPADAKAWVRWLRDNYRVAPEAVQREVALGMILQPRGSADDIPDALHSSMQIPSLLTRHNWPNNMDGSIVNGTDAQNSIWTAALDFSALVGLANDRAGKTQKLLFWQESSVFAEFSAAQYAELMITHAPVVRADPKRFAAVRADILGLSDGVPGYLDPDSMVVMDGLPGVLPEQVKRHPDNAGRRPKALRAYGSDAEKRGPLIAMMGMRVRTPKALRHELDVTELERRYGLNGDEVVSDAVAMWLDWLEPPPNTSALLQNARPLVARGYEVFKASGCANCHRGPFFTDNLVHDLDDIGTEAARAKATGPLQTFVAPNYDPKTGKAVSAGGIFAALFTHKRVGYKPLTLRNLWATAPYLHDGGVAVALGPKGRQNADDLRSLLRTHDGLYGAVPILAAFEQNPEARTRANAALSLQALLLESERKRVRAGNRVACITLPGRNQRLAGAALGIEGAGHEFWIDDEPGGERVSALVAFLLALDDAPGH